MTKFILNITRCHMSCVMCHMSHVRCHLSGVTFQVSSVTYFFFFFLQSCRASWGRVGYQWGLPHLLSKYHFNCHNYYWICSKFELICPKYDWFSTKWDDWFVLNVTWILINLSIFFKNIIMTEFVLNIIQNQIIFWKIYFPNLMINTTKKCIEMTFKIVEA